MDKTKLCKRGQKEIRKWLDDYRKVMHLSRDEALNVFNRQWRHISHCKICKEAMKN